MARRKPTFPSDGIKGASDSLSGKRALQNMRINCLVICKIADSALRRQLFGNLKALGAQICPGAFECDLSLAEFARLEKILQKTPYGEGDLACLYFLCASCHEKKQCFGSAISHDHEHSDWLVI